MLIKTIAIFWKEYGGREDGEMEKKRDGEERKEKKDVRHERKRD